MIAFMVQIRQFGKPPAGDLVLIPVALPMTRAATISHGVGEIRPDPTDGLFLVIGFSKSVEFAKKAKIFQKRGIFRILGSLRVS